MDNTTIMEIFIAALIFVGFSFIILGFNIFFRKDRKFPEGEIGRNKPLRKKGLMCAKDEERKIWRNKKNRAVCDDDACASCGINCIDEE